jgi:acetyl-CoA C-acetyltransferase
MGVTAENLADQFELTREAQDAFATQSQNKTEAAQAMDVSPARSCRYRFPRERVIHS